MVIMLAACLIVGYIVWRFKEDDPNRAGDVGFSIFLTVVGSFIVLLAVGSLILPGHWQTEHSARLVEGSTAGGSPYYLVIDGRGDYPKYHYLTPGQPKNHQHMLQTDDSDLVVTLQPVSTPQEVAQTYNAVIPGNFWLYFRIQSDRHIFYVPQNGIIFLS